MEKKVKKIQSIFFMIMLVSLAFLPGMLSAVSTENEGNENGAVDITIVSHTEENIVISYDINTYQIDTIDLDGIIYTRYGIPGESNSIIQGFPDLPTIRRSIIIPNDKEMNIREIKTDSYEIDEVNIIPSKGSISRSINPEDVPYRFDDIYGQDVWYPETVVQLDEPYILRDFRGQVIHINPIQYNPSQQKIRIVNSIELEVFSVGPCEKNIIEDTKDHYSIDVDFNRIYANHFINYNEILSGGRYTPVSEKGNMIVITYDDFYEAMIPFVTWKNMKGIPTEMFNLSDIGSTANETYGHIQDYYFTKGLTFVLLVGDIAQMPSLYYSGYASDPSYSLMEGDDYYQDLFVGRFSANNLAELETQITRSIEYEKNPQGNGDWYHTGLGVAYDGGSGIGHGGLSDDEHMEMLRGILLNFTYTEVEQSYSPWGSTAIIADALNAGTSIVNYCGHGGPTSWSNGGGFTNSNVNNLENDNMLPYIVSVACNTGEFDNYNPCFGEAWLRATNDETGEPTGAIGFFGSTQAQSWAPPMAGQLEIVDLLVSEENFALGALSFLGTMFMMDEYPGVGWGFGPQEAMTWTYFGDPSLQIRTDTPDDMIVEYDDSIMTGATEFEVTVNGVEDALCAISHNGVLLGYAYTDANGEALITLDEPIEEMEELDFVVTAFNKLPYITVLDVTPPLRNIPEFAPMQGVLIRYPFGIPFDLIAEMSEDVTVVTIVASSSQQATVESLYTTYGVNTDNCEYLIAPTDTFWTRDYGPWFRYNVTIDEIEVIDFEYNRPRPNDTNIPNVFAGEYGLNSVYMDIVHTGGNYMTDGKGISASTTLVLSENPLMSEQEIHDMFNEYLGIQTYHLYPDPTSSSIDHIDCWAKFLSTDTIMIIEVDESHSHYDEIEAAVTYFANQMSSEGTTYNVVRVYTPNDEPYVNSLILNDKVLVPITGSPNDAAALASYESAMPGYTVLGFTGSWHSNDALHCRVNGIPDLSMVQIDHNTLVNQMPKDDGFRIQAKMIAYGASNEVVNPQVHWRNNSGIWNTELMTGNEDTFTMYIKNHPFGETIEYYLSAQNSYGTVYNDPFIGEADPYSFSIMPVPDIWVEPDSFHLWGNEGQILTDTLTIGNSFYAGETLNFTITCSNNGGSGWLSVDPDNGSLVPDSHINISVIANTTGLSIGVHTENLFILSNDPNMPTITIPVELDIVYGDNVGAVSVNYPIGTVSYGSYTINATVQNFGSNDQFNVPVHCSIFEGGIGGVVLDEDFSSYPDDWTITHTSGTAWSWSSTNQWMYNTWSGGPNVGYLDSPVLDCSGKTGINLSFWHHWKADYSSGTQNGFVRGSIDGGETFPFLIDEFLDQTVDEGVKEYDLSWAEGQSEVVIRFDVYNDNNWYWRVDDVNVSAEITGPLVYYAESFVDIPAYDTRFVEFSPDWVATGGTYGIQVTTLLEGDEYPGNDVVSDVVFVEGPNLAFEPDYFDFGLMMANTTDSTSLAIWNDNVGTLSYALSETCDWVSLSSDGGSVDEGEVDTIMVYVNTTGLEASMVHTCDISISSDGGDGVFTVSVFVVDDTTEFLDIEQELSDRGFRLMPGWDAAQEFVPSYPVLSRVELYMTTWNDPVHPIPVEIRKDDPIGDVLFSSVIYPADVTTSFPDWGWVSVDVGAISVEVGETYVIVLRDSSDDDFNHLMWGVYTSFGIPGPYPDGNMLFRKLGFPTWMPIWDFDCTFKTYGMM